MGRQFSVELWPEYFGNRTTDQVFLAAPEPVGVAPVGETVHETPVDGSNQGRNGVCDQAQTFLAACQGLGALMHSPLQFGVLVPDQALEAALLGDVRIDGNESAARQRLSTHGDDSSVWTDPFEVMGFESPGCIDSLSHHCLDVAGSVFASLGVCTHESLERRAKTDKFRRHLQHFQKSPIPCNEPKIIVDDGESLIDHVQTGLDKAQATGDIIGVDGGGHFRHGGIVDRANGFYVPRYDSLHLPNSWINIWIHHANRIVMHDEVTNGRGEVRRLDRRRWA